MILPRIQEQKLYLKSDENLKKINRDELIYNPLVSNSKMLIGDRSLLFFKDSSIESLFIACKPINHNNILMNSEKWESFIEVIN